MKRYKRIMSLALSVVMALLATLCFSGCFEEELILSTYGDFIITQHNKIYDLSEEGLQKEYIIVPEKINGDYTRVYWDGFLDVGPKLFTKSEKLKKVYFEVDLYVLETSYNLQHEYDSRVKDFASALRKTEEKPKMFRTLTWGLIHTVYYSHGCYIENCVKNHTLTLKRLSNIQFMYNYEEAPNEGYYWIDDLETGETLSYIPKDPTREGYTFGGWYADKECTTPYDFTAPYVKKELEEDYTYDGYLNYVENYPTFIYAKWIEN